MNPIDTTRPVIIMKHRWEYRGDYEYFDFIGKDEAENFQFHLLLTPIEIDVYETETGEMTDRHKTGNVVTTKDADGNDVVTYTKITIPAEPMADWYKTGSNHKVERNDTDTGIVWSRVLTRHAWAFRFETLHEFMQFMNFSGGNFSVDGYQYFDADGKQIYTITY